MFIYFINKMSLYIGMKIDDFLSLFLNFQTKFNYKILTLKEANQRKKIKDYRK